MPKVFVPTPPRQWRIFYKINLSESKFGDSICQLLEHVGDTMVPCLFVVCVLQVSEQHVPCCGRCANRSFGHTWHGAGRRKCST